MTTLQKTIWASLILLGTASAGPLWAQDAQRHVAEQINAANGLLRQGNIDGAIAGYQQAREAGPLSSDLSYNLAVAQYRKGDVSTAAEQFRSVAAADNDAIASRARFNLGNCDYVSGLQLAEKDRPAAIERLESAIGNYRTALDINPNDADARANIELASQLIDKLREQEKQEQQQNQQQQDQQQNQQDQSQQQQDQQQNQQQNNQQQNSDQQDQQQQNEQQQKQNPSESEQQNKDQQSESEQSQQQENQAQNEQSQDESKSDEQKQQNQQNESQSEHQDRSAQQAPSRQNRQQHTNQNHQDQSPEPQSAEANQEQGKAAPKGELSAAEPSEQDANRDRQDMVAGEAREGEMTDQEAAKMLQAIRDREMIRRLRQQAAEQNQHIPVDRDW